jgi:tartronate-semialdehyde synthase
LAVGARFNDRHTGDIKVYKGDRKFIHVDVDPAQLGKNLTPDLGICADAKLTLQALLEEIQRRKVKSRPVDLKIPQVRSEMERKTDYDNIPIKPQRVFKEINEFFDEETVFVTCIGLNQIWSGQLQKITKPRHYLDCGGAGPLGWDMPASIGAKIARPDKQVVTVVGDYGFQFCMDALPVAVMYKVPFLIIVLNNGFLGLIRQAEKYMYEMEYEVEICYDCFQECTYEELPKMAEAGGSTAVGSLEPGEVAYLPENEGRGFNFVKFAEACGAAGERVTDPNEIEAALKRAVESGIPYVLDIILEKDTDCSMGVSIDAIREFE